MKKDIKFHRGQVITLPKDISTGYRTIKEGTDVKITAVDPFLKTYDIVEENNDKNWINEVDEKDLLR